MQKKDQLTSQCPKKILKNLRNMFFMYALLTLLYDFIKRDIQDNWSRVK